MFDHLLELSHRDDSYKLLNIGFVEKITRVESVERLFYKPYLELCLLFVTYWSRCLSTSSFFSSSSLLFARMIRSSSLLELLEDKDLRLKWKKGTFHYNSNSHHNLASVMRKGTFGPATLLPLFPPEILAKSAAEIMVSCTGE